MKNLDTAAICRDTFATAVKQRKKTLWPHTDFKVHFCSKKQMRCTYPQNNQQLRYSKTMARQWPEDSRTGSAPDNLRIKNLLHR